MAMKKATDVALLEVLYYGQLEKLALVKKAFGAIPFGSSSPKRDEVLHKVESNGPSHTERPAATFSHSSLTQRPCKRQTGGRRNTTDRLHDPRLF